MYPQLSKFSGSKYLLKQQSKFRIDTCNKKVFTIQQFLPTISTQSFKHKQLNFTVHVFLYAVHRILFKAQFVNFFVFRSFGISKQPWIVLVPNFQFMIPFPTFARHLETSVDIQTEQSSYFQCVLTKTRKDPKRAETSRNHSKWLKKIAKRLETTQNLKIEEIWNLILAFVFQISSPNAQISAFWDKK